MRILSLYFRYVCVLRGQIVTRNNRGLPGVRVSRHGRLSEGFTLSRKDGYFDFVGNCQDEKLELKFGKSPFPFQTKVFDVIPNQVIYLDDNPNQGCIVFIREVVIY